MALKAVKKVNVSEEVYKQILNEIITKNLQSGDKLPSESDLAKELGVSRVSVRAALQRLAGAGIIESINGEGTFVKYLHEGAALSNIMTVAALDDYDLSQIIDFRRGIEGVSAELAARLATNEEIEKLRDIMERMERENRAGNVDEYAQMDLNFHLQIAKMSKNVFIQYIMEQLSPFLGLMMQKLNRRYGAENGFNFHENLYRAIADHNQGLAQEYAELNILNSRMRILDMEDEE